MAFAPLVQIETKKIPVKKVPAGLGCDACPSKKLWKRGIKPVWGKVRGKKLFIIAQSPGHDETQEGKELVGKSGQWLWTEMKKVGLRRKDCDIQNAVRCMPTSGKDPDTGRWINTAPDKAAVACCSKYTARAIRKSKAKVYIIFGEVAARQVCGRDFKKGQKIFWSNNLNAKVYCLDHPSYFLRGGSTARLTSFRVSLAAAAQEVTGKHKGDPRYAALEKQDYKYITTIEEAHKEARLIRRAAKKGIRTVFDSEEAYLEKYGKRMPLVMGTCFKPGRARVFVLYHPDIKMKRSVRQEMLTIVAGLLNDKHVKKVAHHGVSDADASKKLYGVKMRGLDFDTEYASFFHDPRKKGFGLKALANDDYPEFSGYASIIIPSAVPPIPEDATDEYKKLIAAVEKKAAVEQYMWYRARGLLRYDQVPAKQLLLYNGADCDITKRIEIKTKYVPMPLLHVYMDSAWVLDRMEHNGPVFDFTHHKKLREIYPPRLEAVKKKIAKIAGKDFNPGSPKQLYNYIYNVLKLEYPFELKRGEKINTAKAAMEYFGRTNKFCALIAQYRKLSKMVSTYLNSFEQCAIDNDGRLRTKWWLTGTKTGRLSSGGTKNESVDTVINLQNVHGDAHLQNQAVPDKNWRECYDYGLKKLTHVVGIKLVKNLRKYADDPKKLYDQRDDETGKVTYVGLLSKIREKLRQASWKEYAERVLEKYGDTRIFLGFDFGQIEVRVLAQLSGDKNLIADCKAGDIHSLVGHAMTGWAVEKIKKDKKTRTLTKNIHFGIMYGLNPDGVYDFIRAKDPDIQVTREDVQRYYDAYFRRYPGVRRLTEKLREMAERKGYVKNMFGFRRPLNTSDEAEEGDTGAYWGNQAINCLDFKTEILTQRGWLKGTKLKIGDVALTKNAESGKLEWQTVQDVKVYPDYDQPLVKFASKSFSAASTLDHRWLVKNGSCKTTADLLQNKWHHLPRTGEYDGPGGSSYPDDIVRLAGWYLTDGYSRKQGGWYGGHGFALCQSSIGNPEKVKMLDLLAKRLKDNYGFHVRTQLPKNRKEGEIFWHFSGGLASFFAGKFPKRTLTPQFLTELTAPQLEILLHTMILGDGWGSKLSKLQRKTKLDKISFCTGKRKQADAFQILCMLTGRACSVKKRDMSKYAGTAGRPKNMTFIWNCNVLRRKFVDVAYLKNSLVKNKGVWCPVVPNTYFVARRKGQPFITGNTPIQGAAHQLMLMAVAALKRFRKKYLKLLGIPTMEVHDALYFFVRLKDMIAAKALGKELLETEPIKVIKNEYPKVRWDMPLVVEGKNGFRLGDTIETEGLSESETLAEMILETCIKESQLELEMKRVA